jgi:hypothetical protein
MTIRSVETLARVSRGIVCGHETARGRRGPAPDLCGRCRRRAALATRLRQAAKIARELVDDDLGSGLHFEVGTLAIHLHQSADRARDRRLRRKGWRRVR